MRREARSLASDPLGRAPAPQGQQAAQAVARDVEAAQMQAELDEVI